MDVMKAQSVYSVDWWCRALRATVTWPYKIHKILSPHFSHLTYFMTPFIIIARSQCQHAELDFWLFVFKHIDGGDDEWLPDLRTYFTCIDRSLSKRWGWVWGEMCEPNFVLYQDQGNNCLLFTCSWKAWMDESVRECHNQYPYLKFSVYVSIKFILTSIGKYFIELLDPPSHTILSPIRISSRGALETAQKSLPTINKTFNFPSASMLIAALNIFNYSLHLLTQSW